MVDPCDRSAEIRARLAGLPDPVALLAGLFTAAPVAFQIFDAEGRCLLVNDALRELFGDDPPPGDNLLRDETAAANDILGLVHRAFAGERITTPPFHHDPRLLRQVAGSGGRARVLVASFFPLRAADGRVAFVAVAFKDVTPEHEARAQAEQARRVAEAERAALHVSEERRRLAVEAAGTGTWDWEPALGRLIWDARCCELFGVAADAAVDHALFLARVHPDDRARVEAALTAVRIGDRIDLEYRVVGGCAEGLWIRSKGQVLRAVDGEHLRMIGTVQDISDRKRDERALQAATQRAEAANQAKDEFLALLGHELRNPLSPILTALHLMRMRHGDVMEKERAVIERQVQHMVRLVDDLLDVSRITRGKVELKQAPIELAAVVDDALEIAGPLLDKRAHQLTLTLPRAGLRVVADAHRLAQAIANLLTNAARYTDPGGAIEITARAVEGWAVLAVRDSGAGIAPELLPRIFDMFVQGERPSDRADGGIGLGLAIVRSLVELHGGSVSATSGGPGRGSVFELRLPLAAADASPERGGAQGRCDPPTAGHRVLVVDDNRDAAELLADVLAADGHTTRVAFDGPEALRVAAEFCPELAVLDIGLPVMDGFELGGRLRELPGLAGLKLVALTGYGQPVDRERGRAAGFDEHLTKPVELAEVEAVVRRLVGGA